MICKANEIVSTRKAYTNKNGIKVKSTTHCITDRGNPGKGPKLFTLKKGTLTQFGYNTKESDLKRHNSLKKAISKLQSASVIHKLNAVKLLTKNTNPKVSKIFDNDIKWIQNN